jgi:Ca2+/H+ antiporter
MLVVSHWTNHPLILGVEHADMVLLVLTLGLSIVTFSSGRINVLLANTSPRISLLLRGFHQAHLI